MGVVFEGLYRGSYWPSASGRKEAAHNVKKVDWEAYAWEYAELEMTAETTLPANLHALEMRGVRADGDVRQVLRTFLD